MADTATQPASQVGSPKNSKKKGSKAQEQAPSQLGETDSRAAETVDDTQKEEYDDQADSGVDGLATGDERGSEEEKQERNEGSEEGTEAIVAGSVNQDGDVVDDEGNVIGHVKGQNASQLEGSMVDQEGDIVDSEGNVVGRVGDLEEVGSKARSEPVEGIEKPGLAGPFGVQDNGDITNATGNVIGKLAEGEPQDLVGASIKEIDDEGNLKAKSGSVIGKAELSPQLLEKDGSKAGTSKTEVSDSQQPETSEEKPDLSILKDKKVNKLGKIVDENGNPFGTLVEGEAKKLAGKKVDAEGKIWDDAGKVLGRAELLPESEREAEPLAPFEDFPDSIIDSKGNVIFEGKIVGKLAEGDAKKLEGKKIDADGDILDKNGNVLGKAERYQEEEEIPEAPEAKDVSILEGKKVNKAGNVVDDNGKLFGRIADGEVPKLIGKKVDAEGKIWNDSGKVIGTAELIPMDEREEDSGAPFEDFPDTVIDSKGNVTFEGQIVGKLIEGDAKKLAGKKVDKDGEIVDKIGNVLGKAERWEEPDKPEPEAVDLSALAGKRVNKVGNVVDSHGQIYGRLAEGDPKKLAGKMCDKDGNVWNDGGTIVGRAELVPESEREGEKEGPFAGFNSPTVTKDGKVADSKGDIIGRLTEGDAKKLYGKEVDADGDVLDKNGNTLGKTERWEEEVKEKSKNPVAGRKINRDGNVLDDDGDVIGKLVEGDIGKCIGKEIDDDGDIVNSKGQSLGHISLLEDIPLEPVQEQEDPEEVEKKKQLEQDKKLANQMAGCVQQSIDKIKPILKMITDAIDAAERQPKEELDEQKLVDTVKPLLEEGGQILQEANGVIRGLDPDGRIQANAKSKTASREATPEEHRLAEVLKELTENVTKTIDQAKKKIAGMPHAKKELNPLWGLLAEPLGQILAAVGLLLSGVLGLVGRLLSGLGLGGLLDNLLGGLGIKGILKGLGLGMVTDSLTGKK
ncbi:uncharacterized protein BP5553_02378 [Venustampulla echinocandica]|uniref:DUF6987 domain-containing protein n=1 Tax=Venustampulla echinocandica TaxID=2656787 RepID=A0A370U3P8_9HELO|nr:uncharacterized protein BP5553_02378 [Venustampulla echinocandica]RDL42399.1 hypothetical protein BP5553_02378 [Venustampulla echinocandica]